MKITKLILKEAIKEALDEQEKETDSRQRKVADATASGRRLDAEGYAKMLKRVLLSPNISSQDRLAALEAVFGNKGSAINSLVVQMLKGAQK